MKRSLLMAALVASSIALAQAGTIGQPKTITLQQAEIIAENALGCQHTKCSASGYLQANPPIWHITVGRCNSILCDNGGCTWNVRVGAQGGRVLSKREGICTG